MKLLAMVFALVTACSPAMAWDIKEMNDHIDQTNFIVGQGCSGTLVDLEDRLILTNHHCVESFIKVRDHKEVEPDGTVTTKQLVDLRPVPVYQRTYDGHEVVSSANYITELVAWDEHIDLGLLQMRSTSIPMTRVAELYTGDVLRGETAWVVGNPLGFENTVMKGVISSTNRLVKIGTEEIPYLQVDAGVTGGNSGGALYNDRGQFIGVPGAAARGTVVGLAVPVEYVIEFLDEFCRSYVYDPEAVGYDECMEPEEEETEE